MFRKLQKRSETNVEKTELIKLFDGIDEETREFALDALDEYLYFKGELEKLKKYPLIRVSEKKPEMQKITAAGKLIKDYSQILDAKRATILRIFNRVDTNAADELEKKLSEFI